MKTPRITHGFSRLSDAELETKATSILTAMTGNTNFANPVPPLADVSTALKNFSDALAAAKTGDKVKVVVKKDIRKALNITLTSLANYVNFIGNGDRAILVSSGFSVLAETPANSVLGELLNFAVEMGPHSGEVTMSISSVVGAKGYLFLYRDSTLTGDAWMHVLSSYPSLDLAGLQALGTFSFRIGVIGAKDQVAYTDIITKTVV